jgi:hypothetical protein
MSHIKATRARPGPARPQPKAKRKSIVEVAQERYREHKATKKEDAAKAEAARAEVMVVKMQKRADKMTRIVDKRDEIAAERKRGANAMKQQLTRAEVALQNKREALKQRTMTPDQKLNEARQKLKKFRIEQDAQLADDQSDLRSDAQVVADANSVLSSGSIAGFLNEQARLAGQQLGGGGGGGGGGGSGINFPGRRNSMPLPADPRQSAARAQMGALMDVTAGRANSPSQLRALMDAEAGAEGGGGGGGGGTLAVTDGGGHYAEDDDSSGDDGAARGGGSDDDEPPPPGGRRRRFSLTLGATVDRRVARFRNSIVAASDALGDAAAALAETVRGPRAWRPEELFAACAAGDQEELAAAVAGLGPASVEMMDGRGRRPLCVACAHARATGGGGSVRGAAQDGHALCVRLLLQRGANPLLGTPGAAEKGMTGVHQAALHGAIGCLAALLDHALALDEDAGVVGLNAPQVADCEADDAVTPLMLAAANGQLEAVRALLQAGASVARRDGAGRGALHHAAGASYKACKALLEAGAPHAVRDGKGKTAAEVALGAGQRRTAELLAGWGGGGGEGSAAGLAGLDPGASASLRRRERRTSVAARGALEGVRSSARERLLAQAAAGRQAHQQHLQQDPGATHADAAAAASAAHESSVAAAGLAAAADAGAADAGAAGAIEERWDGEQQRPYFFDTRSGHSAWLRSELTAAAAEATARADAFLATGDTAAAVAAAAPEHNEDGVSEHYDEQGYMYYYNAVTGATSYVREEVAPQPATSAAEAIGSAEPAAAEEWPAMARRSSWLHGAKEYTKAQAAQAAEAQGEDGGAAVEAAKGKAVAIGATTTTTAAAANK